MSNANIDNYRDRSGGNTATFNGMALRPGVIDPENRIINGAFDFWQRGTSFTTSVYSADRWLNSLVGGTVSVTRQAFTPGDQLGNNNPTFFLRQSVSGQTLANQYALVQQRIEGVRSYAGETITVLGWARRSSGTGNMAVEVGQAFGNLGSPSPAVTGIGSTVVTLQSTWTPFAVVVNVPSLTGKTIGTDGIDHLQLTFWSSAGTDFNARAANLGLQTIGVDLWGIHIKLGTHTTAAVDFYVQPQLGPELVRCQRYYERLSNSFIYWSGNTTASVTYTVTVPFKVTKRATALVTKTDANSAAFPGNTTSATAESFTLSSTASSAVAGAWFGTSVWAADAEL
jgi:hypothetical protein